MSVHPTLFQQNLKKAICCQYAVKIAKGSKAGLQMVAADDDLILLDVILPSLDGMRLCQH